MIRKILLTISLFFGLSKSELRGMLLLLALTIVLLCIPMFHTWIYSSHTRPMTIIIDTNSMVLNDDLNTSQELSPEGTSSTLIKIDVNSLSLDYLQKLGINTRVSNNIVKYLNKGGKFKNPEDLRKIYGIDALSCDKIVKNTLWTAKIRDTTHKAYGTEKRDNSVGKQSPMDINLADSALLVTIDGIGPSFAKRIVKYRDKLGGYVHISQLNEVYGITASALDALQKATFISDGFKPKQILINTADLSDLSSHPYLGHKKSKVIYNYLKNHSKFVDFKDFQKSYPFSEAELENIREYISYE